jgi:hypothetical protein
MSIDLNRLSRSGKELLAQGVSDEDLLEFLRREGASMFESVKLIIAVKNTSLKQAQYLVHLSATWSDHKESHERLHEPHYGNENVHTGDSLRVESVLRIDEHLYRLDLSNGSGYEVAWDVVLMSCEPLYEHYGGFTDTSKVLTARGFEDYGPFRIR